MAHAGSHHQDGCRRGRQSGSAQSSRALRFALQTRTSGGLDSSRALLHHPDVHSAHRACSCFHGESRRRLCRGTVRLWRLCHDSIFLRYLVFLLERKREPNRFEKWLLPYRPTGIGGWVLRILFYVSLTVSISVLAAVLITAKEPDDDLQGTLGRLALFVVLTFLSQDLTAALEQNRQPIASTDGSWCTGPHAVRVGLLMGCLPVCRRVCCFYGLHDNRRARRARSLRATSAPGYVRVECRHDDRVSRPRDRLGSQCAIHARTGRLSLSAIAAFSDPASSVDPANIVLRAAFRAAHRHHALD